MTLPVNLDAVSLPVTQPLLTLLGDTLTHTERDHANLTALTFHFRNPTYSPTTGGVHPVEIRLICQAGVNTDRIVTHPAKVKGTHPLLMVKQK